MQRILRQCAAAGLALVMALAAGNAVRAAEDVAVTLIPVSVYGPWFIVQEKGMAQDINLEVKVIEDITARNAGLSTGHIQCMMTTMDSTVVAHASGIPVKHVAVPLMSYGLDEMVVSSDIQSVEDFAGRAYAADYGFLNHMWMLLTLKRAGMAFDSVEHKIMIPQDATAAFVSGALDIDVNFIPFSTQSMEREDSYLFKSSRTDGTWERGLISDSIACNTDWMSEKPMVAKELLRSWFEAVDWWKENPAEGNEIIARGLDWPVGRRRDHAAGHGHAQHRPEPRRHRRHGRCPDVREHSRGRSAAVGGAEQLGPDVRGRGLRGRLPPFDLGHLRLGLPRGRRDR